MSEPDLVLTLDYSTTGRSSDARAVASGKCSDCGQPVWFETWPGFIHAPKVRNGVLLNCLWREVKP